MCDKGLKTMINYEYTVIFYWHTWNHRWPFGSVLLP